MLGHGWCVLATVRQRSCSRPVVRVGDEKRYDAVARKAAGGQANSLVHGAEEGRRRAIGRKQQAALAAPCSTLH